MQKNSKLIVIQKFVEILTIYLLNTQFIRELPMGTLKNVLHISCMLFILYKLYELINYGFFLITSLKIKK